ncbi:MAG: 4Fe-4S dicluster domain-containing protein, partial [Armatimonadota bacterium]|nr:4Fe-4S dicluster domain-containing protein [Armatimonadota bacterium]
PVWEEVTRKCLSCGVCAYECPTCHCYDIVDEATLFEGVRCRNWDCCGFALFTLHASGHNPRPTQMHRYRQRVLHKFAYFLQTYGQNMCVGCGRCIVKCPVGMDIYEIVQRVGEQVGASEIRPQKP